MSFNCYSIQTAYNQIKDSMKANNDGARVTLVNTKMYCRSQQYKPTTDFGILPTRDRMTDPVRRQAGLNRENPFPNQITLR